MYSAVKLHYTGMRTFALTLSFVGLLLFGSVFILSYVHPTFAESAARGVMHFEVERRVGEKLAPLGNSKLMDLARRRMSENSTSEIDGQKRQLLTDLHLKVAATAAEMRNANCTCRKAIDKTMTGIVDGKATEIARLNARLAVFIRTKYMEVAESLTREFRIFTGANAAVFGLLGITTVLRRRAGLQLALPSLVLLGAAALVGYFYLFNQNWLHTIFFGDYVGFAYFAYLGMAITFLADIALNRARVTTNLLNGLFRMTDMTFQVAPC
jgi:hypothetical protein